ncbi:UbiA family prenyltransferase [Haloarchaeobius sp. TZWWS8]|uniref:UbiA family prenyltransferase n=1 Tax=Haloarchaeobius sp. TZWWS8 TaxID=3446121 RepID=UPI003EBC1766
MNQSNDRFRWEHVGRHVPDSTGGVSNAFEVVVHTSLLDGAVAATKVVVVSMLLSVSLSPAIALGFLVALAVYGSNKLVDDEDEVNCPERAAFVSRHRTLLTVMTVGSYLFALGIAALEGPLSFGLVSVPGLAAVLYSVEWVPYDDGTRLKDVLFVNTALVAAAWAIPLTFLPITYADRSPGLASFTIFGFFFLQTVVAGEVMNARDVVGDRREGVSTLSTRLGVERTRRVLLTLDFLTAALLGLAAWSGVLAAEQVLALTPALLFSLAVTSLVGRDRDLSQLAAARDAEYPIMFLGVLVLL